MSRKDVISLQLLGVNNTPKGPITRDPEILACHTRLVAARHKEIFDDIQSRINGGLRRDINKLLTGIAVVKERKHDHLLRLIAQLEFTMVSEP